MTSTTPPAATVLPAGAKAIDRADPRLALLLEVTTIPTAAGREDRVVAFVRSWVAARPELFIEEDAAGNLTIAFAPAAGSALRRSSAGVKARPANTPTRELYITAHLDHPAFVVERIVAPGTLELSFRGGVMDAFFKSAPITLHTRDGEVDATLAGDAKGSTLGKHYLAEVPDGTQGVSPGDIATWRLPPAHIDDAGMVHTHACDDLSAVAAALCALEHMRTLRAAALARGEPAPFGHVRVLLTRAEEVGFIGAIAAVRLGTIPQTAIVLALENSRAFADSPLGAGPIVRVGDRLSIFTPWVTGGCAARAEEMFGSPTGAAPSSATPTLGARPWQRKLMSGGACEASVFCHAGYDATCICLPLGNYHNMAFLDLHQAGTYDAGRLGPARCAPEQIHAQDFLTLIDLLVGLGQNFTLDRGGKLASLIDKLYRDKAVVLGRGATGPTVPPRARLRAGKVVRAKRRGAKSRRRGSGAAKRAAKPRSVASTRKIGSRRRS